MPRYDVATAEQIWSAEFTFAGVRASEWGYKEKLWKRHALEVVENLAGGTNVGVRLGTGGGKTIIAILAATAMNVRTLFLTPTRYLTMQHDELLRITLGYRLSSRVITGETPKHSRVWNRSEERFIFATGAVFHSALKAGQVVPGDFALVIFDEFHRARGKYEYVDIAPMFVRHKIPRLALSASPGSNREEVEFTLSNIGGERIMSPGMPEEQKIEERHFIELSPEMKRADRQGWKLLRESIHAELRLAGLRIPENWRYPARALDVLREEIRALPTTPRTKQLRKQFAKYRLYLYAYSAFMTHSYSSFLAFVEGLRKRKRPSDRMILGEPIFRRLVATARHYHDEHPKILKLERLLRTVQNGGGKAVVFFADKVTARYCKTFLQERGVCTEVVFGGVGRNLLQIHTAIDLLREGKVTALLATSVLHEGVSIPEVDLVINYAVAQSAITRLQSSGRTGRMRPGKVIHLVLDHDLDRLVFFPVHNETEVMQQLFRSEIDSQGIQKGQLSLFMKW